MGSRDIKSKERERAAESRQLPELLARMEREIMLTLDEMSEILSFASCRYDLFPRISSTLRLYWYAKNEALRILPKEISSVFHLPDLKILLAKLDEIPGKDDEMNSQEWLTNFKTLRQAVEHVLTKSRNSLLPLLEKSVSADLLRKSGIVFLNALKNPFERSAHVAAQ